MREQSCICESSEKVATWFLVSACSTGWRVRVQVDLQRRSPSLAENIDLEPFNSHMAREGVSFWRRNDGELEATFIIIYDFK